MSYQSLSEKLALLEESNAQLRNLIERLATINFQPGSVPLNNDEGDILEELASEIQQTIRDQEDDFELLTEDVKDLDGGRPDSGLEQQKSGLEQSIHRAEKELKACQSSFRQAQLTARANLRAARKAERDLLLQSYVEPRAVTSSPGPAIQQRRRAPMRSDISSTDDKTVNASSDVTLALRRTHDLMTNELSRSQFAHDTLKESTAALTQLNEAYSTLDTLLSSSRNLLGTLLRSQKSDTWYLESAFYILLCTIAWLVFRRFFYGPLWWFLWFPMKMFLKGWFGVFTTLGLAGKGKVVTTSVSSEDDLNFRAGLSTSTRATAMISSSAAPSVIVSVSVGAGEYQDMTRSSSTAANNRPSPGSVSEQVGRIIDEGSGNQPAHKAQPGEGNTESKPKPQDDPEPLPEMERRPKPQPEVEPNPKKRAWEEPIEASEKEQKSKDEL